ncbi:hypothetical protein BDV59DRAFT_200528 [Aspergillus ambiguus]|uniref:uncharacterized protein n=1 Tax=Aspergillus ambiguus TaxID=176160 RepID=UPI003CCE48AA
MPSLLFATSICLATSSTAVAYFYFVHRSLERRIVHGSSHGTLPTSLSSTITSIPPAVFTDEYYSIHDHAACRVSRNLLPGKEAEVLFTLLLRRNMTAFARFPQAWILRLVVPPVERKTFSASHLQSLNFDKGDLVCGVYRVEERTPDKVVFKLLFKGPVSGRLVIRYTEEGDEVVYHSETAMWTRFEKEDKTSRRASMPLEKPLLRFLHEMAAWWLLESGCEEDQFSGHLQVGSHPEGLGFIRMELTGSQSTISTRMSSLESEIDRVLYTASFSRQTSSSLDEEIIRSQAESFAKLLGDIDSEDESFETMPDANGIDGAQGNAAPPMPEQNLIFFYDDDVESVNMLHEESDDTVPNPDHEPTTLLDRDLCEVNSRIDDDETDMDLAYGEEDQYMPEADDYESTFSPQCHSIWKHGSGQRTSMSPRPEDFGMSGVFDEDVMDCDDVHQQISLDKDRKLILEAQVAAMKVAADEMIDKQAKGGDMSCLARLAAFFTRNLSFFGLGMMGSSRSNDRLRDISTGMHPYSEFDFGHPDPNWKYMDTDEVMDEISQTQAKLDAIDAQIVDMRNAFSRKMLAMLVERQATANQIFDRDN